MKRKENRVNMWMTVFCLSLFLCAGCGKSPAEEEVTESTEIKQENSGATLIEQGEQEPQEIQKQQKTQDPKLDTETAPADVTGEESMQTDIYDHVLDEYRDMVQNDFYMDLVDSENYDSSFGEDIGLEIRIRRQKVYYTFFDIDGNEVPELVIAGGDNELTSSDFSPWNYDLYGYDGSKVVPIFPDMEFGYRTNFSLYKEGIIGVFYSSSAAESGIDFYKLAEDGFSPERIDAFHMVGRLDGEDPVFTYFQNGEEIEEEQYNAAVQSYQDMLITDFNWIQIR